MANGHTHRDVGDESDCERGWCNPDPDTVEGALEFLRQLGIDARYEHTGGGIFCITIPDARYPEHDRPLIYVGTANNVWGWGDEVGDDGDDWALEPLCDGEELGLRIYAVHVERKRQGEDDARKVASMKANRYPTIDEEA